MRVRWSAGARGGCESGMGGRCLVGCMLGAEFEWGCGMGVRRVRGLGFFSIIVH